MSEDSVKNTLDEFNRQQKIEKICQLSGDDVEMVLQVANYAVYKCLAFDQDHALDLIIQGYENGLKS